MKFDIDSLRTLQAVAEAGTLQLAADELCLSRSAVSWKLKRLQERTGCSLLRKEGRQLRLTDDGRELLEYGRQILDAHDAAVRRFLPIETAGLVRVGATEGGVLDPVARHGRTPGFADMGPRSTFASVSTSRPQSTSGLSKAAIDVAVTLVLEDDIGADDVMLSIDNLVWGHSAGIDVGELESIPLITWGPTLSLRPAGHPDALCGGTRAPDLF